MAVCLLVSAGCRVCAGCLQTGPLFPSGEGEEDGGWLGLVLWGLAGLWGMDVGGECSLVEGCCGAVVWVFWDPWVFWLFGAFAGEGKRGKHSKQDAPWVRDWLSCSTSP